MEERLRTLSKTFGDLVVDVVQSQNVEDIETFLAFLDTHEATIANAREAAEDRLKKLKIAHKWHQYG